MASLIHLPTITVQPDFYAVVADVHDGAVPDESFWLSCYKTGETSVHGKVRATLDEKDRNLVRFHSQGGVDFKNVHGRIYTAACPEMGVVHTQTVLPVRSFSDPLPVNSSGQRRKIAAFDVAPDGSQFATGYDNGKVYIVPNLPPRSSLPSTESTAHLNAVTALRFFPSSRALLTAGVDFALSILPAEPLYVHPDAGAYTTIVRPVRTFKGHSRAVTSIDIVSRGRNVVSGAKDGTVRLWDVPSGSQITMLGTAGFSPVWATSIGERGEGAFLQPPNGEEGAKAAKADEREVETADKVLFCALQDGTFQAFDLGAKQSIFHSVSQRGSPALQSIAYSPSSSLLATGSVKGVVTVYDTRSLDTPLTTFSRNSASVEDLAFVSLGTKNVGLAVAAEDGLPYVVSVGPEGPVVQAELIGVDCDAVRYVRSSGPGEVWTASDDGIVRKYESVVI